MSRVSVRAHSPDHNERLKANNFQASVSKKQISPKLSPPDQVQENEENRVGTPDNEICDMQNNQRDCQPKLAAVNAKQKIDTTYEIVR